MSEKRAGKNKILILFLVLIISAAAIRFDASAGRSVKPGYEAFFSVMSYPQRAFAVSWRRARDFAEGVLSRGAVERRNRELMLSLSILKEKNAELEGYRRENLKLRELLDFRAKGGLEEIFRGSMGAEVIGRNPLNWYRTVILDRGGRDGISDGMIVVGVGGVVGRVINAGDSASAVMLILHTDSRVSAVVERTGEHGIITGRGDGILIMKYLSDKSEVQAGDFVRTSGLGEIFPKGLSIGTVAGVSDRDYGLTVAAEISPAVDFSRLENVLILRN